MADPTPSDTNPTPQASPAPTNPQPQAHATNPTAPARTFRPVAPPPAVPRGPARRRPQAPRADLDPAPSQTATQEPPVSRWRALSNDPEERAEQRASMTGEAAAIIEMLDGVAQAVPPGTPLADWERKAITPPLEETLYKYGANVDPAITLLITLGGIALMRWQAAKAAQETAKDKPITQKAA